MLDRSRLTGDERDVLANALDEHIRFLHVQIDIHPRRSVERADGEWRLFVARELRDALN